MYYSYSDYQLRYEVIVAVTIIHRCSLSNAYGEVNLALSYNIYYQLVQTSPGSAPVFLCKDLGIVIFIVYLCIELEY